MPLIDRVEHLIDQRQFSTAAPLPALERLGVNAGFVQAMAAGITLARGDHDAAERIIDATLPDHAANSAPLCIIMEMKLAEP